jgi:hypothetical protein
MAGSIRITNLAQVLAGFDATEDQYEKAAQYAITVTGLAVERQAKINANTGTHKKGEPRSGGPGPNVVTGNLRRSITTKSRYGFGTYIAEVSATMSYARHVELGGPNWKPGVKYPFLGPAATSLKDSGKLSRTFTLALASKLRG